MHNRKKYKVLITGIVQGVGMRPYIYNLANTLGIEGWVSNHGNAVVMEIAGSKKRIGEFILTLRKNPPSNAKINDIRIIPMAYEECHSFTIIQSSYNNMFEGSIPTDTAICENCLKEIKDKNDRRFDYPFTNCTSCGPRYSIFDFLPFDRRNTSMTTFEMCPACRNEYESSDNRRFHAQTNCCPDCGPKLFLFDREGNQINCIEAITTTLQLLQKGYLIGIKGIGGYHIACNALDEIAIERLRKRKLRPDKPLSIMAANIDAVKKICKITEKEEEVLLSRQRPIVLLEKLFPELLPHNIAPRVNRLGVMLPYTPLHHLLFQAELQYLIMTSGNISGMPINYQDEAALINLKEIVDYFLIHNREIRTPLDDSVIQVVNRKIMVSRNARGFAPSTIQLASGCEMIAMGAEQKASLCILHQGYAHTTQYLGNLDEMKAFEEYIKAMKRMNILLDAKPQMIAHDLHTGYLSTHWANKQPIRKIPVQHHHAHMASCLGEYGLNKEVIGIIYDGTGMGTDGAIWGGEIFIGSRSEYSRIGQWKYVTIQGGDRAIKEPWKIAASYLYAIGIHSEEVLIDINGRKIKAFQNALRQGINCFQSSSMGRLFDCVSALVMDQRFITYDAQAAIELESLLDRKVKDYYPYVIHEKEERLEIDYEQIIVGILLDKKEKKPGSYISAKFHNTVCEASIACACRIRNRYGIEDIVLSGGVFENTYLLQHMIYGLKKQGFQIYHNLEIPINDGGIAFGQVVVAAQRVKEGNYVLGGTGKDITYR